MFHICNISRKKDSFHYFAIIVYMAYYLSAQGKSIHFNTYIYFLLSNIFFHSRKYISYECVLILANLLYFSISSINKISKHDRYRCEVMLCCH